MENSLPVEAFREDIEKLIEFNSVVIITAETGAGKSTMIPRWLWKKGLNVTVTQPRRIAARALATYLAKKNSVNLGTSIGYQTGFEKKMSRDTRLLFVTDGVQMVKEIRGARHYDILIIDEIHEWNLNQEVLIGIVKKSIDSGYLKKSKKKIIIMSATMQAKQLSSFLNNAPIIDIPGRGYPVTIHNHHPDFILSDAVEMVKSGRNLLIFQPGKKEIEDFKDMLEKSLKVDKLKAHILSLHSEISTKAQGEVFNHYKIPKVVIATDIAQTSITIDDIDTVIDTGLKKEIRAERGIEGLFLTHISESECKQRAGRAGRVKSGQYLLCSELDIRDRNGFPEPEIRRLNLESVILRLIKWKIHPSEFLFFHSPKKNLIYNAISKLKTLGAVDTDEIITEDGKLMAEFPVSIRSARMMIEALKGGKSILDDILKIIAIIEVKGIGSLEFSGIKIYEENFRSDLLNQLALWNTPKLHKKLANFKKLSLARDIYKELKKRIKPEILLQDSAVQEKTKKTEILIRTIISAFVDFAYKKADDSSYVLYNEDKERRLDNKSILNTEKPDMLTGLPFDLIINRENRDTGEKEKIKLALISFATEISLKQLDYLKPFSYEKNSEPYIDKGMLLIKNTVFFGGAIIAVYDNEPNWKNPEISKKLIKLIMEWFENNMSHFNVLNMKYKKMETDFNLISKVLSKTNLQIKSFRQYWKDFIINLISKGIKTNDLNMFFKFNTEFLSLSIRYIIPKKITKVLVEMHYPPTLSLDNEEYPIIYENNTPLLKINFMIFEQMNKENMVLISGAKLILQLNKKKFNRWEDAVSSYNKWKKLEVFKKKWENNNKLIEVFEDVIDIPFPHKFTGGYGMNNEKFVFYSAPEIIDNTGYLIHFQEEEKAVRYYEDNKKAWEDFLRNYKKNKIESIFKDKGWKIKT